ncbi:efflux RND transporter permease subunit [Bacillus wiedmannii]|uniref:efflux RND transporter permease subunit n=1 Tax=Bacillus wiedmannii TaxID=1890302 RepID=UPI000BF3E0C4|nr:efflux RND transporter permease subunit [Bacillus wiedmannii]PGD97834.1 transporter [Bacillus wiedmannii]PHG78283.1 transporter [Bacillus wiedmannii]
MIKLTDFSMRNVAAVIIIIIMLIGGGLYMTSTLKIERLPDVSLPYVTVTTQYLAPPDEIVEQITEPLEKAALGMEGVKNVSSTSSDNFSLVSIELEEGKNPKDLKKEMESALNSVKLPDKAEPKVSTITVSSLPVYTLSVYSDKSNEKELKDIYDETILTKLNSIKGMERVEVLGMKDEVLSIKLDANALEKYGLNPTQVSEIVKGSLISAPVGAVNVTSDTEVVRVKGDVQTLQKLRELKFTTPMGQLIQLNDIAEISVSNDSKTIARFNGKEAMVINLYKTKDTNSVEFAEKIDDSIKEWKKDLPDLKFHTISNDATEVKESIQGMIQEGSLGAVLASLMILFFLKNIRMTLIVLVSIPLSIITTLLFMAPLNITLNIMTLGGMIIAIGRVVDDSIVVIENIYRQLQRAQERNESVIRFATKQVSSAITSSTLTTVAVFAPIGLVTGIVGEVFRPFALTLVCALMASLLVALTVIPMLAKLMVMRDKKIISHNNKLSPITLAYKRTLVWSLNNRFKTLGIVALIFILSVVFITPQLPVSFLPEAQKDKSMKIHIDMPKGTSLEDMNKKIQEIEGHLKEEKDVKGHDTYNYVNAIVGYRDEEVDRFSYKTTIFSEYSDDTNATLEIEKTKNSISKLLPEDSNVQVILIASDQESAAATSHFSYVLKGENTEKLKKAATMVEDKMKGYSELSEVKNHAGESKQEIEINVNNDKAQENGLNPGQIMYMVRSWIAEEQLTSHKLDNNNYKTKVYIDSKYKDSVEKIGELLLVSPIGKTVKLNEVAELKQISAPSAISRENQVQTVTVSAKIDTEDKAGVSNKVEKELKKIDFPTGVTGEQKGVSNEIDEGFIQMFVAMGASILIVYLVMVLTFGNASAPFAILFSLPLAVIGGLLGLLVTLESINVTSLIGFLMLIGIVVTNAIVLIDRVQQLRGDGYSVREALIEAGITRLRPIIMTAGATIIALLPLAFGMSKGTLVSKGLAVVVIGGLTTSTLLTLVVVPCIYELIENSKKMISRLFKKNASNSPNKNISLDK